VELLEDEHARRVKVAGHDDYWLDLSAWPWLVPSRIASLWQVMHWRIGKAAQPVDQQAVLKEDGIVVGGEHELPIEVCHGIWEPKDRLASNLSQRADGRREQAGLRTYHDLDLIALSELNEAALEQTGKGNEPRKDHPRLLCVGRIRAWNRRSERYRQVPETGQGR
jgi:hypothetical protein